MHSVLIVFQLLLLVVSDDNCLAESLVALIDAGDARVPVSNCAGVPQHWGNRLNIVCFS